MNILLTLFECTMKTDGTNKGVNIATPKKEKQPCPVCGSKNTYSNPRERGKHLYCNHCGHEQFD